MALCGYVRDIYKESERIVGEQKGPTKKEAGVGEHKEPVTCVLTSKVLYVTNKE